MMSDNDAGSDGESAPDFEYGDSQEGFLELETTTGTTQTATSWPASEMAYVALTSDDILLEQQQAIKQTEDLTALPSQVCRQLLQEMKWNYEAVAELYYEDECKLLSKAGISANETVLRLNRQGTGLSLDKSGNFTCQVCYESFEGETQMLDNVREYSSCGHALCKECWFQHLKTKIIDEGASVRIACPGYSMDDARVVRCNIILDELFVNELLKEVELVGQEPEAGRTRKRYQKQLNDNYVNNNFSIKWCPATDCTSAVRIKDSFDKTSYCTDVTCSDGHSWCFNCMDEPHAPADCKSVKEWRKKCAFTKDCPKCKVAINKDGGCNHMHCKQCEHHFCWVCLGDFEHTTYRHKCNQYVEDDSKTSASRAALHRYTHYYDRFMNHSKSRELESKLREKTIEKMEKMQDEGNKTWLDVQFMKQATTQLIQARQILQWTYVLGFHEPSWLQKNIFDMNQSELEGATEKLSNMLETEDIMKWCNEVDRVEMINQTNQVGTRLKHLFSALEAWKRIEEEANREKEAMSRQTSSAMAVEEAENGEQVGGRAEVSGRAGSKRLNDKAATAGAAAAGKRESANGRRRIASDR